MMSTSKAVEVYDLSYYELSDRHGSYYGMAGDKDGIIINGNYWIVKYPKSENKFEQKIGMSYNTSPLSEFIGSHIYEILGISVHETMLGIRNNKVVVACKDFCKHRGELMEMKGIRNGANRELSEKLDKGLHYSSTGERVNLNELLLHLDYNPIIQLCPEVKQAFWEMVVVDILIDNTDRNNGNWGLLYNEYEKKYTVAPVYDNGNSFSNKASEDNIKIILESNSKSRMDLYTGSRTAFEYDGHIMSAKKMIRFKNEDLQKTILRLAPIIKEKMEEIESFINDIPCRAWGKLICSDERKKYYIDGIEARFAELIWPEYEKIVQSEQKNNLLNNEGSCKEVLHELDCFDEEDLEL